MITTTARPPGVNDINDGSLLIGVNGEKLAKLGFGLCPDGSECQRSHVS